LNSTMKSGYEDGTECSGTPFPRSFRFREDVADVAAAAVDVDVGVEGVIANPPPMVPGGGLIMLEEGVVGDVNRLSEMRR
jgi:hypothetical protein